MADYDHELEFGFFLDPGTDNPARTLEIARKSVSPGVALMLL